MKVKDLIERLQEAVATGENPDAEVMAWDPDSDEWAPVTVLELTPSVVRIYTDEP